MISLKKFYLHWDVKNISTGTLHARPVNFTALFSVLNSVESRWAISSQSAAHLGLLAAASVANMRSFDVDGHLKGAILCQRPV